MPPKQGIEVQRRVEGEGRPKLNKMEEKRQGGGLYGGPL